MGPDRDNPHLSRITTEWDIVFQAHEGPSGEITAAQTALMLRYAGAIHRYLLRGLGDPDAAAELDQEFALKFLRGDFHRADPSRGRFRDFVKRALRNLMVDFQRRKGKRPAPRRRPARAGRRRRPGPRRLRPRVPVELAQGADGPRLGCPGAVPGANRPARAYRAAVPGRSPRFDLRADGRPALAAARQAGQRRLGARTCYAPERPMSACSSTRSPPHSTPPPTTASSRSSSSWTCSTTAEPPSTAAPVATVDRRMKPTDSPAELLVASSVASILLASFRLFSRVRPPPPRTPMTPEHPEGSSFVGWVALALTHPTCGNSPGRSGRTRPDRVRSRPPRHTPAKRAPECDPEIAATPSLPGTCPRFRVGLALFVHSPHRPRRARGRRRPERPAALVTLPRNRRTTNARPASRDPDRYHRRPGPQPSGYLSRESTSCPVRPVPSPSSRPVAWVAGSRRRVPHGPELKE